MKNPIIPENEADRLASLDEYNILDTLPEKVFDDITSLAAQICGTPIALISFIDEKRQWFKSHHGLDVSETPREIAYCAHAINDPDHLLEVEDATQDERFKNNPLLKGAPHVRYYAGAPMVNAKGHALGTLCVIDHQPRKLTAGQRRALDTLSKQVVLLLETRILERNLKLTQFSFENSPAGIAWINERAEVVKFNQRYAELRGQSLEEIRRKKVYEFNPDFDESSWKAHWKEMSEKKTMTLETHFTDDEKKVKWVELNLKMLDFQGLQLIHAVCIDITESMEAKAREKEIMKGLKELINEKDDLIGLFSHDMKSPINQVKGLGQIMSMSLDDKEILKESLTKLDQTVNRQLTLYKNILYMLKSDHIVSDEKEMIKVPLATVIKKAVKSLGWEADAKNISFALSISDPIEISVQINLFVQGIQNLLSNAIKFSHEGGEVRIFAEESNGMMSLSIQDDGIGFDQAKEQELFKRFTKAGRKGTNNEASTGLGLYLVKKIVENHHGSIRASSGGDGKGSTFVVQLPSTKA